MIVRGSENTEIQTEQIGERTDMKERWLPVAGWPGYSVSDQGRVRKHTDGPRTKAGILHIKIRPGEYPYAHLSDGQQENTQKRIHTIVLEAFVGPCPRGQQGQHVNDIKSDNKLSNLKYGTPLQNSKDAKANGILVGHASRSKVKQRECFAKMVKTRRANGSFLGLAALSPKARAEAGKKISVAAKARVAARVALGLPPGRNTMSKTMRAKTAKKIGASLKAGHASEKYAGILFGRAAFTKEERHEAAVRGWKTRKENN